MGGSLPQKAVGAGVEEADNIVGASLLLDWSSERSALHTLIVQWCRRGKKNESLGLHGVPGVAALSKRIFESQFLRWLSSRSVGCTKTDLRNAMLSRRHRFDLQIAV